MDGTGTLWWSMVRRRSTVRFRKGAPQLRGVFGSISGDLFWVMTNEREGLRFAHRVISQVTGLSHHWADRVWVLLLATGGNQGGKIACRRRCHLLRLGGQRVLNPVPSSRTAQPWSLRNYLREQWNSGCTDAAQLWRKIRACGYRPVIRWSATTSPRYAVSPPPRPARRHPPKPRKATAWIMTRPASLAAGDRGRYRPTRAALGWGIILISCLLAVAPVGTHSVGRNVAAGHSLIGGRWRTAL